MAYTNLSDLFTGICNAIRAKTGKTGSINHQDIPSEIEGIETGADVTYNYDIATTSYCNRAGTYSMEITKEFDFGIDNIVSILLYAYDVSSALDDSSAILFLWYEIGLNGISPHGRVGSANDNSNIDDSIIYLSGDPSMGELTIEIDSSEGYVFDATSGYRAMITFIES